MQLKRDLYLPQIYSAPSVSRYDQGAPPGNWTQNERFITASFSGQFIYIFDPILWKLENIVKFFYLSTVLFLTSITFDNFLSFSPNKRTSSIYTLYIINFWVICFNIDALVELMKTAGSKQTFT